MTESPAEITGPELKPENYETVILCSPVWASNMSAPARTWLSGNRDKCKNISYLLTCGGGGQDKALKNMQELGGKAVRTVYFSDFERKSNVWIEKLTAFANEL